MELTRWDVPKRSAGILLYRTRPGGAVEVLLVHPGGPLWARKDLGAWSIPKGEYQEGDDPLRAALREFEEELGVRPPAPLRRLVELGTVRQRGGKQLIAWAAEGDLDLEAAGAPSSNTFRMEWPPRSGQIREFPEVDRAEWFDPPAARAKLNSAQVELLDRLLAVLAPGA
jgi:predicted NUDIX family NTP pyrophosphohydrolase